MRLSFKFVYIVPLLLPFLLGSTAVQSSLRSQSVAVDDAPQVSSQESVDDLLKQVMASTVSQPAVPQPQATAPANPNAVTPPQTPPAATSQPVSPQQTASIQAPATLQPAADLPEIPLRVAIAIDAPTLAVATSSNGVIVDQAGNQLATLQPQAGILVQASASGLQMGDWSAPSVAWVKPTQADGLVYVEGRWYRGPVQIVREGNQLLAINHIDLETYLYSVVGAEMPTSWPQDALKAQAIAARSYAIVHMVRPADPYFDLGSTQRWQAYHGVQTEANSTYAAVDGTRGMLLSYNGGVVESLYAASEEIVRDAHSGFGMSQHGANALAQKNLNFQQILGHFYPGTQLALLNVQDP